MRRTHNLPVTIAEGRAASQMMAEDALRGLALNDALFLIEAHIEARPGLDGEKLEAFANRLRQHAWRLQRGETQ